MLFKRRKKTDDTQLHIESIPDESTKGSCNVETITRLRREILSHRSELGDRIHEVNRILNKIAELDMEVQSED